MTKSEPPLKTRVQPRSTRPFRVGWREEEFARVFSERLTVGLVDQTVHVVPGRLVAVSLTQRPVVRGRPASGRRGLHHAERCVRTHVVVHVLAAAAARAHLVYRHVPLPQRGRRVLDLSVDLVAGFALDHRWTAVPRVLRAAVLFPAHT